MEKLTNQQYKFVCELIWGGVPSDKAWVESTSLFQVESKKILEQYPLLDKSFFKH